MQHEVAIPSAHVPHVAGENAPHRPQISVQPACRRRDIAVLRAASHCKPENYGGIPAAVRKPATEIPIPGLYPPNQSLEQIELVADVQVPAKEHSFTDAVERFSPVFGTLLDLSAFDMAVVPGFGQVDMIDISNPAGGPHKKIGFHQPL
jgi:hypothetical protein